MPTRREKLLSPLHAVGRLLWRVRVPRWLRRLIATGVAVVLLLVIAAVVYVASVPLPADPVVPQASVLYYRDGRTVLARVGISNRTDVDLAAVPMVVRHAVLAAEDRGFYQHSGVSLRGIARAGWSDLTNGSGEGASTITQQYVRNAYLTQQRTASRKAKEIALSLKVEDRYPKDEILRRYLNTIYLGRGAYGIQAGANAYFGTTVDRLNLAQAAVLAAVIKDPYQLDPAVDPAAARDRWRWVLQSMVDEKWADAKQVANLAYPAVAPHSPTAQAMAGPLGLIVDAVESELDRAGIPPQVLRTRGLHIVTTIDQPAESAAIGVIGQALGGQPSGLQAALVAIDPATGGVRAYYGGDHGSGYFDYAITPRAPASTFKPLALAQGLMQGIAYSSLWNGSSPREFPDRGGVPLYNPNNLQCRVCALDLAMVRSLNTPFYALAERVGPNRVRNLAQSMGVPATYQGRPTLVDLPGEPRPFSTRADIAIGRYPVAPADLAEVYATFASGGVHHPRHMIESVARPDGAVLYTGARPGTRVLPAAVAADVTHVLTEVVQAEGAVPGRMAAAKPGTQQYGDSTDNQDAWTAGYTPQLTAVTWLGRDNPAPIRDAHGTPISGDGLPYTIWRDFLTSALAGQPAQKFPAPGNVGSPLTGEIWRAAPPAVAPNPQPAPARARRGG